MNVSVSRSLKGEFIQLENQSFFEVLKKDVVASALEKQWKKSNAIHTFSPSASYILLIDNVRLFFPELISTFRGTFLNCPMKPNSITTTSQSAVLIEMLE